MQKDKFIWHVQYRDGSVIEEISGDRPDGRGFAEIDASQVAVVGLSGVYHVAVPECAVPVFFRRRRRIVSMNGDEIQSDSIHCIGWKSENNAAYLFVFEDGSSLLSSDLNAV